MIWGREVAGLPGRRVKSYCASAELMLHDLGSPGCRVAGLPNRIKRLSKVVCLESPLVAGLPGRRVKS